MSNQPSIRQVVIRQFLGMFIISAVCFFVVILLIRGDHISNLEAVGGAVGVALVVAIAWVLVGWMMGHVPPSEWKK